MLTRRNHSGIRVGHLALAGVGRRMPRFCVLSEGSEAHRRAHVSAAGNVPPSAAVYRSLNGVAWWNMVCMVEHGVHGGTWRAWWNMACMVGHATLPCATTRGMQHATWQSDRQRASTRTGLTVTGGASMGWSFIPSALVASSSPSDSLACD